MIHDLAFAWRHVIFDASFVGIIAGCLLTFYSLYKAEGFDASGGWFYLILIAIVLVFGSYAAMIGILFYA